MASIGSLWKMLRRPWWRLARHKLVVCCTCSKRIKLTYNDANRSIRCPKCSTTFLAPPRNFIALYAGHTLLRNALSGLMRLVPPDPSSNFTRLQQQTQTAIRKLKSNGQMDMAILHAAIASLADRPNDNGAVWQEDWGALVAGATLAALVNDNTPQSLRKAFELFCEFRSRSEAFLPAAFPLIARMPELGPPTRMYGLAYIEYLACAKAAGNETDTRVLNALQHLCLSETPYAEELNQKAKRTCGFQWAAINLVRLYYHAGDFSRAEAELQELEELPTPDDQNWDFDVGIVRRGLQQWSQARKHFARVLHQPHASHQQAARIYLLEASIHELEDDLSQGIEPGVDIPRQWQDGLGQLQRFLSLGIRCEDCGMMFPVTAQLPAQRKGCPNPECQSARVATLLRSVETAVALVLQLGRRFRPPQECLQWLWGFGTDAGWTQTMQDSLATLMLDSSYGTAADFTTDRLSAGPEQVDLLHIGRWWLAQGRLSQLEASSPSFDFQAGTPQSSDPRFDLLAVDFNIRIGAIEQARRILERYDWVKSPRFDVVLQLQLEVALAAGVYNQVGQMLNSPSVWLLPWLARAMYQAELAGVSGGWDDIHWKNLESVAAESARAALSLGQISLAIGQDDTAAWWFKHTLSIEPTNIYARLGKALVDGPWPAAAQVLRNEEPRVTQLARAWAQRLAAAGRHDLATRLHGLDTSDNQ